MNVLARFAGGLTERVLAVVLAVALAQFPLYYAAYSNTLAGARTESEARYLELEKEASQLQLSVEAFIQKHENNADPAFVASGRIHRNTVERYQHYQTMGQRFETAPVWQRPLVLARNFDREIYWSTHFQPGVPLSLEGAAYALAGVLLAWLLAAIAGAMLSRPRHARAF